MMDIDSCTLRIVGWQRQYSNKKETNTVYERSAAGGFRLFQGGMHRRETEEVGKKNPPNTLRNVCQVGENPTCSVPAL